MQKVVSSFVLTVVIVATIALTAIVPAPDIRAQQEARCFAETGFCIEGRFREYWEQNGGLPVFGYPISPAEQQVSPTDGKTYLTQWFERNRFEYHPQLAPPYDVLLGLLGAEQMGSQPANSITAYQLEQDSPRYFAETGYSIAPEFWDYWQSHGLELGEAGISRQESLALFGYPISPAQQHVNPADGNTYLTQWFERTRFEYHPDSAWTVQLGLLGNEQFSETDAYQAMQRRRRRPTPTFTPTPTPSVFAFILPSRERKGRSSDSAERPTAIPTQEPTNPITPTDTPIRTVVPPPPSEIPVAPARVTMVTQATMQSVPITVGTPGTQTPVAQPTTGFASPTALPSLSPAASLTPAASSTPLATPSASPSVTATPTSSQSTLPSATATSTPSVTATPTSTPSATATRTPSATATPTRRSTTATPTAP